MEKIVIYLCGLWVCCLTACSDNEEIGYVEPWEEEYVLPQGKSDADDRIVDFYEQYGRYILYDYTYLDFRYELGVFEYELPDPQYVGDMLDFLNEIWFNFYPEDFKKEYLPLKIFLAGAIEPDYGGYYCLVNSSSVGVGFCSDILREFTPEEKLEFMRDLQIELWDNYLDKFDVPEEFFELSSYTSVADTDPESGNYARNRGFVEDYTSTYFPDWYTSASSTGELSKDTDLISYIMGMILRTSEDWAADLEWPLVKQKYDLLRDWLMDIYGVDLQKMGDTTYE